MYDYKKEEGDNPLFTFRTDNSLTYYVAFRKMGIESYPLDNLYSLDFDEIDHKKGKNDDKISSTVLNIIVDFLDENDHVIVHYLCENIDYRHLYRKRLFSRWFSITSPPNWIKYDITIEESEDTLTFIYNSYLYGNGLIEKEIMLLLDSIQKEK